MEDAGRAKEIFRFFLSKKDKCFSAEAELMVVIIQIQCSSL